VTVIMSSAASVTGSSRFDEFLYAAVLEDANGMPLTVLSFLARRNVDPWEEAARLAQLPGDAATRLLAGLIVELPPAQRGSGDAGQTAARLVALLPRAVAVPFGARPALPPSAVALKLTSRGRTILYVGCLAALLLGEWLLLH